MINQLSPSPFFQRRCFYFSLLLLMLMLLLHSKHQQQWDPRQPSQVSLLNPRVQLHTHLRGRSAILTQPPLLFSHDVRLLRTNSPMQSTMVWTIAGWPWRTQSTARAPATAYRETTFPQVTPSGEVERERDTESSHQWMRAQYGKVLRSRSSFDLEQREVMSLQSENLKFPLFIYLFNSFIHLLSLTNLSYLYLV